MATNEATTCADRIDAHYHDRMDDIRRMMDAERRGDESGPEETGPIHEYGLSFEYIIPEDTRRGFWCSLISTGGPAEEFRFYGECVGEYGAVLDRIEFRFHDWFDGAGQDVPLDSDDGAILREFFEGLAECGVAYSTHAKAHEA